MATDISGQVGFNNMPDGENQDYCNFDTSYSFMDPSGGVHALHLDAIDEFPTRSLTV
jgi:hypothetical protein